MIKSSLHSGHRERIKNRFIRNGLKDFDHHSILEMILFFGIPQKDTNEIAHTLLKEFGSISCVFDAPYEELCKVKGVGTHIATLIKLFPCVSSVYLDDKNREQKAFNSYDCIGEYLIPKFVGHTNEVVYIICLDGNLHIKCCELLCEGTAVKANIDIKKIMKFVIKHNCDNVVIAHNHPQGLPMPSSEDVATTEYLTQALKMVGVNLLDHIIVARGEYTSILTMY
jgi:DNA repair protein RadC